MLKIALSLAVITALAATYMSYNNNDEDTAVTRDNIRLQPHPINIPDIRPVRIPSKIPESDVKVVGESQNGKIKPHIDKQQASAFLTRSKTTKLRRGENVFITSNTKDPLHTVSADDVGNIILVAVHARTIMII